MHIITRQISLEALPAGTDPLVGALHLAATARGRHASRVAAAIAAARAYLPDGTSAAVVGALIDVELGGVGGTGGFGGRHQASTRRMSWAQLGKGRRNASDGPTWDAAFRAAQLALRGELSVELDDLRMLVPLVAECDLEWPLAYALRAAYATRELPGLAAAWAQMARDVAARCPWEGGAGELARRYRLETQPRQYGGTALLRQETVADLLGVAEADLAEGSREIGGVEITLRRDGEINTSHSPDDPSTVLYEPAWRVELTTRDLDAAIPLVARAWRERWGVAEHDEIVALHAALRLDDWPVALEAERGRWDTAA